MAAKKKTLSEYMPTFAEGVERALLTRPTPRVTEQVGSSRFSTSKKGTGTANDIIGDRAGGRFFGAPDAVLDVTLEQAAKPNPNYEAARQANIGKKALTGFMDEYNNDAAAREASESGRRTVERVQNQRKDTPAPTPSSTTASSSPSQGLFSNVNVRDIATAATAKPPSMGMGSIVDSISPTDIVKSDGMAPAASPAASNAPSRDFNALFKTATGTAFDPKSKLDRTRMAEIQSMMNSRADLADKSDNKAALAWYASKRK
jgi:hypothetical protein